ncbi:MAG TPA: ATP-binding protein [Chitinophagaceae bacterium]|jgi:PAS domain S-box-containing protein|nr:ATP-binding protein [Chitinophagaceae bacterium]
MNNFFRRLPLTTKLLLLTLFPILLIVYLSIGIYRDKTKNVELIQGYIERIDESADIADLIGSLQMERRHSFAFALKKDSVSRTEMDAQRLVTDLAIKKLDQRNDSILRNFEDYTSLRNLEGVRSAIDRGTSQDVVMQYYTTTIFRLNTLNVVLPVSNNMYLKPVFNDLVTQKILSEMVTYLGIIRSNFYNVLYTKKNMVGTLYGLSGIFDIYKSYEIELLTKASRPVVDEYKRASQNTALRPTMRYTTKTFQKFYFDSLYDAETWWRISGDGIDQLKSLQQDIIRRVQASMNAIYNKEVLRKQSALAFLAIAVVVVFGIMLYTTQVITGMLSGLNEAAQKIARGITGVPIKNVSPDVIGSLGESISKIDAHNKQLADAADAIGKGNFNVPFDPRSEDDVLGAAIIRMKDNLRRFTMEIEKSKEQFREVADSAPVMIWMTDELKQCNFVNKGWLKFTGRKKDEELGYGWIEGMHPDDYMRCFEVFEDAFSQRREYSLEYRFRREDGEYRWVRETGIPRYSAEAKFEGFIGSCIDIHETKMHEQRKDDFIRMASHELKTPVTSIKGYVQLLLTMFRDYDANKKNISSHTIQTSLSTIDKQIIKLNRLMSELLDLSRIDSGKLELKMQNFDVNDLVKETVDDVRQTTRHEILIKNSADCKLFGDKDRIGQVLLNLLTNAIKYSPRTNSIEVDVHQPSQKIISISVRDHGIGIDKKDHEKIFERFYRVEGKTEQTYPGFGIGLFIASEIINRHNGTIWVESEKSKGSTFTFTLPVTES